MLDRTVTAEWSTSGTDLTATSSSVSVSRAAFPDFGAGSAGLPAYARAFPQVMVWDSAMPRRPVGRARAVSSNPERLPSVQTPPVVGIAGEYFFVEIEDGTVYLRHPTWSLLGAGESLLQAEQDLRAEARELAQIFAEMPVESMSYEAFRLRDYLFRLL
jgi:hypothetical protein